MIELSVIIPTRNRADYLRDAIASILNQIIDKSLYEIIVVDNGSTDKTASVVEELDGGTGRVRYFYAAEPGLHIGRHTGAKKAKGEILVFTDDDIIADRGWLQAIRYTFNDPVVQLVGGRNFPKYEVEPPIWIQWFWFDHSLGRACGNLSLLDFGDEIREIDANNVWGLNFSIRKSILFELGGFHPDAFPPELIKYRGDGETGLTIKINDKGYKTVYQPKALIYHRIPESRMTYEYFEKRYFYQGISNSFTDIRGQYHLSKTFKKRTSIMGIAKTLLLNFKRRVIEIICGNKNERKLKKRFFRAYLDGYRFHQEEVKKNPILLQWVLKEDYWDCRLPEIESFKVNNKFDVSMIRA